MYQCREVISIVSSLRGSFIRGSTVHGFNVQNNTVCLAILIPTYSANYTLYVLVQAIIITRELE